MKNIVFIVNLLLLLFILSCKKVNSEKNQIEDKSIYQKKVLPPNFDYTQKAGEPLRLSLSYIHPSVYFKIAEESNIDVSLKEKKLILEKAGGAKNIESYKIYLERNSDEDIDNYLNKNVHLLDLNNDGLNDVVIYSHPMSLASIEIFLADKSNFFKILSYTGGYAEIKFDYLIGKKNYLIVKDSESGGGLFSYTTIYEISNDKAVMLERRVYNSETLFPKDFKNYDKAQVIKDSDIWAVCDKNIIEGEESQFYRAATIQTDTVCFILNSHKEDGVDWFFCIFSYNSENFEALNTYQGFTGETFYYGWIKSENVKK
ncbi:MAG TPA: hypothetical protein PK158_13915 [Spirochaetota bacterium]|nr:hypothetical protein [Spirochaetota bacterium]